MNQMPSNNEALIDVPVTLPKETIAFLDALAVQGILGTTKEAVAEHLLKQYLFMCSGGVAK